MSSQIKISPQANRISVSHNEELIYTAPSSTSSYSSYVELDPIQKIDFREINLDRNKHYISFVKVGSILPDQVASVMGIIKKRLAEAGIIQDNIVFIPYYDKLPEIYIGEFSLKEVTLDC